MKQPGCPGLQGSRYCARGAERVTCTDFAEISDNRHRRIRDLNLERDDTRHLDIFFPDGVVPGPMASTSEISFSPRLCANHFFMSGDPFRGTEKVFYSYR